MIHILITGGNGYIGNKLYNFLSNKYKITKITRIDFNLIDEYATSSWFSDKKFDIVIHTAISGGSRLKQDDNTVLQNNLDMYYNLYNNRDHFKKFISFGSGAEIFSPESPYGLSKKIINNSIHNTDNFYNLRIFGLFDHDELNTRFIKGNLLRYINSEPMIIHSNKVMDFYYMDDLISIVDYYISNDNLNKVVNCSYKEKYTLQNIGDFINTIDKHQVSAKIQVEKDLDFYCGNPHNLPIHEIGLKQGIINTYNQLKALYNDSNNIK